MIRNYVSLIGSQVAGRLIAFFWVVYLARSLGPVDYGRYSTILSLTAILTTFIDAGAYFILIRELSVDRERAPRWIGLQIVQRLLFALACSVFLIAFACWQSYSLSYLWLFIWAALHMTFQAVGTVGDTVFAVWRRQRYTAMLNTVQAAGWALAGFLVLKRQGDLQDLFAVMAANSFLMLLLYAWFAGRLVRPRFDFSWVEMKNVLQWSLPIGLTGFFGMIYERADRVLLAWLREASDVALWNAVMTLLAPLNDLAWCVPIIVLFPTMAALYQRPDDFVRIFRSVHTWLMAIFLPIVAGAVLFAEPIMRTIFGERFAASAPLMPVAALFMLWVPFHGLMGRILIVSHQQALYGWSNFFAMVVNLLLNVLLIPHWGPMGSAVACVATHMSLFAAYTWIGKLDIRPYVDVRRLCMLLPPLALATGAAWLLREKSVWICLTVLVAVYAPLALWMTHFFSDWHEVRKRMAAS